MTESTSLYSYRFGQFELQPSERRLLAAGVPAVVEPRAFDVLVTLVERAGHLVTKEELFSLVWPKLIVEDTNLHVQVSALHKILGPAAIATVPGRGYRFMLELTREVIDSAPLAPVAKSGLPGMTFTGSGRELADVKALLGDTRLLTLVGADRIGKTRLLLQVAADVMGEYPDGVWFVDLAPSRDARLVPQAVASVLGVKEEAVRPVIEALLRYVKDRRLLLILDDHLAHACTELAEGLLQSSPHLKFLVSSREQLDVAGESIYPVPGLTNIASPIRAFPEALEAVPNAHEQARRHPVARWRRWQWIAGGAAVFLIAGAGAWLLPATKTTPLTTVTAEPPTLSIAILPFAAPDDEQLAKMLLPELTAAFGRVARSARIASLGLVASYKEKQVDARAIGHEVNVRYVAEGEIQRAGDTRLLSARLIDAASGAQIWSERFEVPAGELPASPDAFATRVGVHLWIALVRAERDRAAHQSPTSLTATDFWLRGGAIADESSLSGALTARKLYEKALQLDPRLVGAMLSLAYTYGTELDLNPQADSDRLRQDLDELSLRAVTTDRADWRAWYLRGYAATYNSRWEEVLDSAAELQSIEPNHLAGFGLRAMALVPLGRSEEALAQLDQGLTLDPSGSDVKFLLRQKCKALSYLGQYEKAIPTCEKAAVLQEMLSPYIFLTAAYAQQGEMDKAASAKMRLLKLNPGFSIARLGFALPQNVARNPVWVQQAETYVIPGLRKAGIPEK